LILVGMAATPRQKTGSGKEEIERREVKEPGGETGITKKKTTQASNKEK